MASILHIDSSPRRSLQISQVGKEVYRCGKTDTSDLNALTSPKTGLRLYCARSTDFRNGWTAEVFWWVSGWVLAADRCVFSVPMYNFSIPSNFKAYIDQVVRVGRTFMEENGQVKGLANGKKFCSSHREALSLEQVLLRRMGWSGTCPVCFSIHGCDRHSVHANGLDMGDEARKRGLDEAQSKIQD